MIKRDVSTIGTQSVYNTHQGDMWDKISLKVYGTEMFMHKLIEANHVYRGIAIFPANVELAVPNVLVNNRPDFPPWRAN